MVDVSNVSVSVRLRPVRFAFLVSPNNGKAISDIFRINTCLWGGMYNPVIPFLKQVPKWWHRDSKWNETAFEIMNGYLDFFEPDFLVETEPGLASGLGFGNGRVIGISDFSFMTDDPKQRGYGLDTFDVYRQHFQQTFQFTLRKAHSLVEVSAENNSFRLFCACVFGAFPSRESSAYLAKAYKDAFEPVEFVLKDSTVENLYKIRPSNPLTMGSTFFKVQFNTPHKEPIMFVMDATKPQDLVDYWNLRAVRRQVLPIPVQWLDCLATYCKTVIDDNYRPLPGNPDGLMIKTLLIFARSISTKTVEELKNKYFSSDIGNTIDVQCSYPSIWQRTPEFVFREMRPTLSAGETTVNSTVTSDNTDIRIPLIYPEFVSSQRRENAWANVFRIREWTGTDQLATVFPSNYKDPRFPKLGLGLDPALPTTEGLVVFPKHRNVPFFWKLQSGSDAINTWLTTLGVKASISDGGRITQQVIQTLGGISGVQGFAHKDLVELLNEVSRRPSHSIHCQEFRNRVNDTIKDNILKSRNFELLVERGAVELGMELRCAKCLSWSWYSLKELDHLVKCNFCLRQFNFPITDPSNSTLARWAYRVIGPFSLPDYAKGGYAASLAIRVFAELVGSHPFSKVTWSTGQEIKLPSGRKVETDFIIWYQRTEVIGNDYPTQVVFGEAKSFGKNSLKGEDIEKLQQLSQQFPGSILTFATMKQASELSKDEKNHLTKLAEWGRKPDHNGSRAPLVILTGNELFADLSLESTWQELGGRHAAVIEPAYISTDNLKVLADLTQQINLNMPSYGQWYVSKRATRK